MIQHVMTHADLLEHSIETLHDRFVFWLLTNPDKADVEVVRKFIDFSVSECSKELDVKRANGKSFREDRELHEKSIVRLAKRAESGDPKDAVAFLEGLSREPVPASHQDNVSPPIPD